MKIFINDKEIETGSENIAQLLQEQKIAMQGVAVAVDNQIVRRNDWEKYALREELKIVIIKAACGG